MSAVFELVEITDEMYFTQGMFESADLAMDAVRDSYPHCEQGSEIIKWEVREHQLNKIGHSKYGVTARMCYDSVVESLDVSYYG